MTSRLRGRVERMLPPSPLARRLSVQSVLFAFGEGTFLTGSAVFFTQIVGLSAAQVGLGITIAGLTSFFFAVPVLTAAILGLNAFLISRLPDAEHEEKEVAAPAEEALKSGALRNRGFLAMCFFDGVLGTNQVLLNVVIPLWLVEATDAPRVLLAWLFGTNTVLAVLLQVSAARGADTVPGALRASRISSLFFVASCLIVLVTHDTIGWITIVLVWVGHVTVTGAELFQSAGAWGLQAELSDPSRRGEYAGASSLGYTAGSVWAPALYTYLAMEWGTPGWLVIAGIVVLATIGIHPSARAAERYLSRESRAAPA